MQHDINSSEPPSLTPNSELMLASFSKENMPISTILSSSSEEEEEEQNEENGYEHLSVKEEDAVSVDISEDNDDGLSFVNWNNIRLGIDRSACTDSQSE